LFSEPRFISEVPRRADLAIRSRLKHTDHAPTPCAGAEGGQFRKREARQTPYFRYWTETFTVSAHTGAVTPTPLHIKDERVAQGAGGLRGEERVLTRERVKLTTQGRTTGVVHGDR
jgi:hypothetical protein